MVGRAMWTQRKADTRWDENLNDGKSKLKLLHFDRPHKIRVWVMEKQESIWDDGEERLRDLCGPDYERLQRQGYSASRLWTADFRELFPLFPGNLNLAWQIYVQFNLVASGGKIMDLVAKKETRDPKLLQWIKERLEYVSCSGCVNVKGSSWRSR
ncbi:uncharacterized protein LOC112348723 [Selaginella moellendorffii]|uniref:uncharacterized protein LOC112348723 n=1 Tax=Selaginella moellendorffii TaxID=88036 RepID=UPI000D1C6EC1|nr:uncharacterized protein LOC112348723 [Selaginella moellendorffii]|eukprot:XP_024537547.1 uncharacterized protein LOC112348723 [Selaginella moellendorffii]